VARRHPRRRGAARPIALSLRALHACKALTAAPVAALRNAIQAYMTAVGAHA
jgi:hypothetical protein